jgi:ribonuclease P protein component
MAPRQHGCEPLGRLTRSAQFQALRRGRRVEAEFGRMQGIARVPSDEVPCALRFGLIVPKRLGNSPQRNRIKRRLRAGLRQVEGSGRLPIGGGGEQVGADIGIFPSAAVLAMNFDALVVQLDAGVAALMRKLARLPK